MTLEASKSTFSDDPTSCSADLLVKAYRDQLKSLLREHIVSVEFTKADGSQRVMNATLIPSMIVPYEKKTERVKVRPDHILPVWDVDADGWRTINTQTIVEIKVNNANSN